tara:strand:- start:2074 stop:3702 length:1629 start_codon:yes stop_codon:yes gene_type:complete
MDYFSKTLNINLLKNYILNDPICDYYNIMQKHYNKDKDTFYKNYILNESENYKQKLLVKIINKSNKKNTDAITVEKTIDKLLKNEPLITNAKLYNHKYNININCDIIIQNKLLRKIFPKIDNYPFHLINPQKYVCIDLSYSTVHFKIDLQDIQNDNLILYKKCNLYLCSLAIEELIHIKPTCFIIAKEYYYKKNLLDKNNFIGCILINEIIKTKVKHSIRWIRTLQKEYKSMVLLPQPSHLELYPNMNFKESEWENEKMKLAEVIKEITLVWNISFNERCGFIKKNIYCWDDPNLLSFLKESKKKNIQERMIHMNQQNDILIYPRKNISSQFLEILKEKKHEFYFDVESFLSFDEKQELFIDELKINEPMIGIIGIIHNNNFKDFTINKYELKDEYNCIKYFLDYLKNICKNEKIYLYHWGHAECKYLEYMKKIYSDYDYSQIHLINILDYFRTQPIIVQGVFKFGLKSIGKALYNHNLIKSTWNENDNGLDSMIQFKQVCKNHTKKIPLKRNNIITEVIEYNRIDCQVLYEIIELLRKIYL